MKEAFNFYFLCRQTEQYTTGIKKRKTWSCVTNRRLPNDTLASKRLTIKGFIPVETFFESTMQLNFRISFFLHPHLFELDRNLLLNVYTCSKQN